VSRMACRKSAVVIRHTRCAICKDCKSFRSFFSSIFLGVDAPGAFCYNRTTRHAANTLNTVYIGAGADTIPFARCLSECGLPGSRATVPRSGESQWRQVYTPALPYRHCRHSEFRALVSGLVVGAMFLASYMSVRSRIQMLPAYAAAIITPLGGCGSA
jgi:hypothetical protein